MNEQAYHLVDRVLPRAPYRQWVLTLPWELARAVAFDTGLCTWRLWRYHGARRRPKLVLVETAA
ncbi:MAG: hypothetical protein ACI9MR_002866 [Myxococcota bacterium]|jgi:hypothetical protein